MEMFTGKQLFDSFTGIDRSMRTLKEIAAPAPAQQSGSSAWLAELEAALTTAGKIRDRQTDLAEHERLEGICIVLEYALATERSRSANDGDKLPHE